MIFNSSPLIISTKIGIIELVIENYKPINITEEVYNEIIVKAVQSGKQDALILDELQKQGKIKIIKLENKYKKTAKKIEQNYKIDIGESETIALALQLKEKCIIIDESLGRNVAKLFNITPKGTLRLLLELYLNNKINEEQLKFKVNEIIGNNFRLDAEVLNKFWGLFENLKKKKQ